MKNKELQILLSTIAVLKQKAYNLHWNIRGNEFYSIHKMTESLFEGLTGLFDEVAEKIAMHGELPLSTFKAYLANSKVAEVEPRFFTMGEVCQILSNDLDVLIKVVDTVPSTPMVQPLIDEINVFLDKQQWFFNNYLQK